MDDNPKNMKYVFVFCAMDGTFFVLYNINKLNALQTAIY